MACTTLDKQGCFSAAYTADDRLGISKCQSLRHFIFVDAVATGMSPVARRVLHFQRGDGVLRGHKVHMCCESFAESLLTRNLLARPRYLPILTDWCTAGLNQH